MGQTTMLGEFSKSRLPEGSVLRPRRRRRAVPGLQRRLRADEDVPAAGQIVLRSASQILR
jgi:hypothetical protein